LKINRIWRNDHPNSGGGSGLRVGARTEFCVIGDVIPGHEEMLRQVLAEQVANPMALL
jgi:hypothetical protein